MLKVIDARDPMGTRNVNFERELRKNHPHKKLVLLLNKVDLIPSWAVKRWTAVRGAGGTPRRSALRCFGCQQLPPNSTHCAKWFLGARGKRDPQSGDCGIKFLRVHPSRAAGIRTVLTLNSTHSGKLGASS